MNGKEFVQGLLRLYEAAKIIDDKGQFCWEFVEPKYSDEFWEALEALRKGESKK